MICLGEQVIGNFGYVLFFEVCFLCIYTIDGFPFLSSLRNFERFSGILRAFTLCDIVVGDLPRKEYVILDSSLGYH